MRAFRRNRAVSSLLRVRRCFRLRVTASVFALMLLIAAIISLLPFFFLFHSSPTQTKSVIRDRINPFQSFDSNSDPLPPIKSQTKTETDEKDSTIDTNDIILGLDPLLAGITDKEKLKDSVALSLVYLLRKGHNRRVEYLIGFTGYDSQPTNYSTLSQRPIQKYDRDYDTNPVKLRNWSPVGGSELPCGIPCVQCDGHNCDVTGIRFSMENVVISPSEGRITGNTKLNSQIPVPYFSWHDFSFMKPAQPKTADAMAAAFISNCGFRKRNSMVTALQKYGVSVHSYGRCVHNTDENREGGRDGMKQTLMSQHKFSLAFENSETDDYITEKFFGTLVSGAVPVYIGAPNVKFFAPDGGAYPYESQHSVIWAGDFDFEAEKLAKHLLYLDSNDTAYNEYLRWKKEGYSGDFKAMVELTSMHTSCRQCNLGGDRLRLKHGISPYDKPVNTFKFGNGKRVYIRERGTYLFTSVQLREDSLRGLVEAALQSIDRLKFNLWNGNDHPNYDRIGPALYAIYHFPSKNVVQNDRAVQLLPNDVELELIFV